jgi:hypothetical protein
MKKFILILKIILSSYLISFAQIENYKVIDKSPFIYKDSRYYALRVFSINNKGKLLAVNVDTLETGIFNKEEVVFQHLKFLDNKYEKLIQKSIKHSNFLQNGGITNGNSKGVFLTVDLCPSSKKEPFEIEAIKKFIEKGNKNLAFAIAGKWLEKNGKYFNWIINQEKNGNLNVIWINHSYTHFYKRNLPLSENFLLKEGTDIDKEILKVEQMLIERGVTPSIFIRFPGLIADKNLRNLVANHYGLIAIGSDSWLAKGQMPKKGSIILIHGNKNEPKGIDIFLKLLQENDFKFLPLTKIYQ